MDFRYGDGHAHELLPGGFTRNIATRPSYAIDLTRNWGYDVTYSEQTLAKRLRHDSLGVRTRQIGNRGLVNPNSHCFQYGLFLSLSGFIVWCRTFVAELSFFVKIESLSPTHHPSLLKSAHLFDPIWLYTQAAPYFLAAASTSRLTDTIGLRHSRLEISVRLHQKFLSARQP
jgi:hypothetical protein